MEICEICGHHIKGEPIKYFAFDREVVCHSSCYKKKYGTNERPKEPVKFNPKNK